MSFSFTLPEKNWKLCEAENLTSLSDIYAERDVVYSLSIWRRTLSQMTQRPVQAQLSKAVLRSCRAVLLEKLLYLPKPWLWKEVFWPNLSWLTSPRNTSQASSTRICYYLSAVVTFSLRSFSLYGSFLKKLLPSVLQGPRDLVYSPWPCDGSDWEVVGNIDFISPKWVFKLSWLCLQSCFRNLLSPWNNRAVSCLPLLRNVW